MNYAQLKTLLKPANELLVLRDADFAGSNIELLLQDFFDGKQINLASATATADDANQEIQLEGTLQNAFLGFSLLAGQLGFSATFSASNDDLRAKIVISIRTDWKLPDALNAPALTQLARSLSSGISNRLASPIRHITLDSSFRSMGLVVEPNLPLALEELPQLLQGIPVLGFFPTTNFPSFDTGLSLSSFEVVSRINPLVVTYLAAEITQAGNSSWEPIGDLLRFKDFRLRFLLMNPLASSYVNVELATTVEVAGAGLQGTIFLPSGQFQCFLAPDSSLDIKSVFDEIADIPLPMDELVCDSLAIAGDPEAGTYDFNTSIKVDWTIVGDLRLTGITAQFQLATKPERSTSGGFSGQISFGSSHFFVSASNEPGATGWLFSGGLQHGTTVKVSEFIDSLVRTFNISSSSAVDQVKDILGGITITQLDTSFHTQTKDFSFVCVMEFAVDDKPSILNLEIGVINTTAGHTLRFGGKFFVGVREFQLDFTQSTAGGTSTKSLVASYANPDGEELNLISGLVNVVSSTTPLSLPASASDLNLLTLTVYDFTLKYDKAGTATTYGIKGNFAWKPTLNLSGDTISPFVVNATVDLTKSNSPNGKVLGTVAGDIESSIEGLDFLKLSVAYELAPNNANNKLQLSLAIGKVTFVADYISAAGDVRLSFRIRSGSSLTLGDILTFLVSLVDPSIDSFELDPPWDFITSFDLAKLLENLVLTVDLKKNPREKIFAITLTNLSDLVPSALSAVIAPRSLTLQFISKQDGPRFQKSTNIKIEGMFLGQDRPLSWDPLNQAPPEIPGQGASVFDLRYMGLGQHVAFTQAARVNSIKEVMDLLRNSITERETSIKNNRALTRRNPLESFGDGGVIAFSPESEWLIGLDVTLLRTVSLSVIFNDPVIYGLRIELTGRMAKNFAGLQFEILYTRITDTIGKYHIDLTLPDFVRYFTVGAVSVTLPILVLDIFTNGDFKVDLGFPWNFNFERSFALGIGPFTGAGGFYFNKLSAATASSTPVIPASRGMFTPVYEFGLGLRAGLGRSFRAGPLKAELSIVVQGLIEGVISWYNPVNPNQSRELYYKISGGIALVGRLYGEVDFGIISASVEVVIRAMVQFVFEVYKPIPILLEANVSVSASVKIAFIRIRFSFSMTVRQRFDIPSPTGTNAPWLR